MKEVVHYLHNFRAADCKNWKDLSLRHCNAYHTKDGPWKAVREKNKELKFKQESLLELRRKLRVERKEKRKETNQVQPPKPKMDLSVRYLHFIIQRILNIEFQSLSLLEEKMRAVEEVRKRKEEERIKSKEVQRQEKIQNQEKFTYQTNEAFERDWFYRECLNTYAVVIMTI